MSGVVPAIAVSLATIATAAGGGFLLGRSVASEERPRAGVLESPRESTPEPLDPPPIATAREHPFGALAAQVAEIKLPRREAEAVLEWRGVAAAAEVAFEQKGLPLDLVEKVAAAAPAVAAADLASLLDARAFVAAAAGQSESRAALLQLARRLDADATRDSIRATLLAHDADALRILAADLKVELLPSRTAALAGAALLFVGDLEEALEIWRAAATEHPEDPVVHLLLGWRLLALAPPEVDEARRHLEAARALLPRSAAVKRRLDALR